MAASYYSDATVTLYLGECREVLPGLGIEPDCVIADPPYGETARGRKAGRKSAPVGRRGSPLRDEATQAIEVARVTLATGGVLAQAASEAGLTLSLVHRAAVLVRRAPDLAEKVHSGGEVLTRAYEMVMGYRTPDRVAS